MTIKEPIKKTVPYEHPSKRYQSLDLLRGALAWSVVAVHCVWMAGYQGQIQHQIGVWSVIGFIVLSGFVITRLLLEKKERYHIFLSRRFMRLFPAFAVCLSLAILVRPLWVGVYSANALRELSETQHFWAHLVSHLTLIHGLIPEEILPFSSMAFLPPGWSVSLEWQLYLIAPLVVWSIVRFGPKVLFILFVGSWVILVPPSSDLFEHFWGTVGAFLPQRFFYFVLGMTFAVYPFKIRPVVEFKWSRPLVFIGQISYSTYLLHSSILIVTAALLANHGLGRLPFALLLFTLSAGPILLGSALLHFGIEKPGIYLGKALTRKSH